MATKQDRACHAAWDVLSAKCGNDCSWPGEGCHCRDTADQVTRAVLYVSAGEAPKRRYITFGFEIPLIVISGIIAFGLLAFSTESHNHTHDGSVQTGAAKPFGKQ